VVGDRKRNGSISPRESPRGGEQGGNYYYSPTSGGRKRFFAGNNNNGEDDSNTGENQSRGYVEDNDYHWEELTDNKEMQEYQMSIASDPTSRKSLIPGAISATKLRYLSLELFGDLVPTSFGTFDFFLTVGMYFYVFWMRIYVHYLAQYLFILVMMNFLVDFHLLIFSFFFFFYFRLKTLLFIVLICISFSFSSSIPRPLYPKLWKWAS
jgi:hypothetical protein